MAIPNQVRQQSERADQLIQRNAAGRQEPAKPAEQTESETQQPNVQAASEAQERPPENEQQKPQRGPTEPEVENLEKLSKQVEQLRQELNKAEQRNRTLDGMIRSERERSEDLRVMLSQMEEAQPAQPAQQARDLSAEEKRDRNDFGDDFVDMVQRTVDRAVAPIMERLGGLQNTVSTTSETAKRAQLRAYHAELDKLLPNWREIDDTQEFRDWVNASRARLAMLKSAVAECDAAATVEVFELFQSLHGKGQSAAPAKQDLSGKVAPSTGRASQSSSPTPAQPRIWRKSEIAQVYRDRRRYSAEEFAELEKEISQAQRERRVDYSS